MARLNLVGLGERVEHLISMEQEEPEEDDKRKNLLVWAHAQPDPDFSHSRRRPFPGLCGSCKYLRRLRRSSDKEVVLCVGFPNGFEDNRMRLDPQDPVVECTEFWPKGHPSLEDLVRRAKLLETIERRGTYL